MDNPIVSVIIPAYNQAEYIDKCLNSVFFQKNYNWECLIIDDGSTDNTKDKVQRWVELDNRFFYFFKKNGGLSSARNCGLEKAKGTYVTFLDSDDAFARDDVFDLLAYELNQSADVVVFNHNFDYGGYLTPVIKIKERKLLKSENIFHSYINEEISVIACNKFYKNNFVKNNGLQFEKGLLHEDELWSYYVYKLAKYVILKPEFTYNYYKNNPNSIMTNLSNKNFDSILKIQRQIIIDSKNLTLKRSIKKLHSKKILGMNKFLLRHELLDNYENWSSKYKEARSNYDLLNQNQPSLKFIFNPSLAYKIFKCLDTINNHKLTSKLVQKILWKVYGLLI